MRLVSVALIVLLTAAGCDAASERGAPGPSPSSNVVNPATSWFQSGCDLPVQYLRRIRRGYDAGRSPEVMMVPRTPNFFGALPLVTSHSGPWDYLQRVPLVFYGPGFIKEQGSLSLRREVTLADLAPTLAELLRIEWPKGLPGRSISEALVPGDRRPERPRLLVNVVWDGGGWNVLNTWPGAWPFLRGLMAGGTSVDDVIAGSSPSITPAIHATIGTGAFPKQHGIVNIPIREGDRVLPYSFPSGSPRFLKLPTLADRYDLLTGNRAEIGMFAFQAFHLGMMGNGSMTPGGDKDIAIISSRAPDISSPGKLHTNTNYYSLPDYVEDVEGFSEDIRSTDLSDGELDLRWMDSIDLHDPSNVRHSPVWALYQTRLFKTVIERERFGTDHITDLFFTNYKEIDDVGHNWNMLEPQMREVLKTSDDTLSDMVSFLNEFVGRKRWAMVITADHGQGPLPAESGAWPIGMSQLTQDLAAHFDLGGPKDILQGQQATGLWVDEEALEARGVTEQEIADFLINYRLEDNRRPGEDIPEQYRGRLREPLFAAAFPSRSLGRVSRCALKPE